MVHIYVFVATLYIERSLISNFNLTNVSFDLSDISVCPKRLDKVIVVSFIKVLYRLLCVAFKLSQDSDHSLLHRIIHFNMSVNPTQI